MQDEITDFPSVLALLNESGLRYVLIGGLAMTARGSAHLTFDIDISYPRTPQDIDALMSVCVAAMRRCVDCRLNCLRHLMSARSRI